MLRALLITLSLSTLAVPCALAQDLDDEPVDRGEEEDDRRGRARPEVKEIVRGFYVRSNVGGGSYVGQFRGFVYAGTMVGLSGGKDVLDTEKTSASVEVSFVQGIHNGCNYEYQADGLCAGSARTGGAPIGVQGDLRTYSLMASGEYSYYPVRRVGIGAKVNAGIMLSPLLMDEVYYQSEVLPLWGFEPTYHTTPHPVVGGGLTLEYYTKLSHFSVGADLDVNYGIGFDLGVFGSGYFKYTF